MTPAEQHVRETLHANPALLLWAGSQAAKLSGGRLSPREAASEVTLLALRYAPGYDPSRARVTTWLGLIARAVGWQARTGRLASCRPPLPRLTRDVADRGADLEALDLPPMLARLAAAVRRLPPHQRQTIVKRLDPAVSRAGNGERLKAALARLRAELIP
jgi:DNA-directed RNA polymerase specialized sigma24 family protein